jgi:hypothetical protein
VHEVGFVGGPLDRCPEYQLAVTDEDIEAELGPCGNAGQIGSTMIVPRRPASFLVVRVREQDPEWQLLCAGYEDKKWRKVGLSTYLLNHLVEFAYRWTELQSINSATAFEMVDEAAKRVYTSEKSKSRGEFGELLLHAVLRSHCNSEPALSKIFFKSSDNETVKGFDCVHVVPRDGKLELWFGEAKFYTEVRSAIREVVKELGLHLGTAYLRREFALVQSKIDSSWPYAAQFRELLEKQRPIDEIFDVLRIPVLLTYDSEAIAGADAVTPEYLAALEAEAREALDYFLEQSADLPEEVRVHLLLVPVKNKAALVRYLHGRLQDLQQPVEEEDDETDADASGTKGDAGDAS